MKAGPTSRDAAPGTRRHGLTRSRVLLVVVAFGIAGCLQDADVGTPSPSPTREPDPTPTVTEIPIDTTVWYAGLVITVDTITTSLDDLGGTVTVELELANPGDTETTVEGPIRLTAGGRAILPTRETELPLVPAGGTEPATVTFDVDAAFDLEASVLRIGRSEEHQPLIPLGEGPVGLVTLEPHSIELAAEGQAGSLFVELLRAELRADLPDWYVELEGGLMALTVSYHATFRSDFPGGFAFTADNVGLRLPDGTVVAPRRDGHSQTNVIIDPGNREVFLLSRFEVPSPGPGSYALVIRDGAASQAIPFELAVPDPGASPSPAGSASPAP